MGRLSRALTAAGAVALFAACGDPVVVIGDAPGIVRIVAGVPDSAGDSLGTRATESRLSGPRGTAVGDKGVLYVADPGNRRILAITPSGDIGVFADRSGGLGAPDGIALDGAGSLLIADPDAHRIWSARLDTGELEAVAGSGVRGQSPDTSDALAADLDTPTGIAVAPDGRVYFSELGSHRVRRLDADGSLSTVAGSGLPGSGGDGGPGTLARLSRPSGLAVAGDRLYIADSGNHRIRVLDLETGTIETVAGRGAAGFDGDGGPAGDALLDGPWAVAVSGDEESLFIADTGNHRVRSVALTTLTITTAVGTGDDAFNGDLLAAGATSLNAPRGLSVSPLRLLYVADTGHHVVRRTAIAFIGQPL